MAKKSVSPIMTWIFWSLLVLGAFLTVTWEYFVAGFAADTSKITWLIVGFFIYGFFMSLKVAFHLEAEFKSLHAMDADQSVGDANSSEAAAMFDSAMERIRRGERIEVRNLITAYGGKLKAKVDNIAVIASMLITMGLLGTVVGLIITVTGLDRVLQVNSADFASMKAGLTQTVSGMGTAFYTTFFGALLGGIVLKVLGSELKKSATVLVADTLRFSELYVAPMFQAQASESLVELEGQIKVLHGQLGALGNSLGGVIETIDTRQAALESGLEGLLDTIMKTNEQATERINTLSDVIGTTIEETSRRADERLSVITSAVESSSEQANTRSNALVSAINQTIEATNRLASERVESIQQSTNENNRLADERLSSMLERIALMITETHNTANMQAETLSASISRTTEESNRLADERLQALVKTVESATDATHVQADAQLAGLVKNVELSIESSRKDAEDRLNAKASGLASKLNEAASMLSALVNTESSAPNTQHKPEGE